MTSKTTLIGLTGNIGCGKSTVARLLISHEHSILHFDCDRIAKKILHDPQNHTVIEHCLDTKLQRNEGGHEIDTKAIRHIIFTDMRCKQSLEDFIHPLVYNALKSVVTAHPYHLIVVESAILFEIGWEKFMSAVITVSCSKTTQRDRLKRHRNMTSKDITKVTQSQLPQEEKLSRCDHKINSDCSKAMLKDRVQKLQHSVLSQLQA